MYRFDDVYSTDLRALGYDAEADRLDSMVSAFETGEARNVAVLSEPYGGRARFLDYVEAQFGGETTRVRFSPTARECPRLQWAECDVLLLEDCHHLYARKIGGFEVLKAFLRNVAAFDGSVVSSWNVFSWEYLRAFERLEQLFETQIRLPDLDPDELATLVTAEHSGDPPTYVDDRETVQEAVVSTVAHSVRYWRDRTLSVPFPRLNREELVRRWETDVDADAEEAVFDEIDRLSGGNPGVARHIWKDSLREGRIRVSDVRESEVTFELDYETGFLLQTLLFKERVRRGELAAVVEHSDLKRALGVLARDRVLSVDDDEVVLAPAALKPVLAALERWRVL